MRIENWSPAPGTLVFESLHELPGFRHAITTRAGGLSAGPYATMNLSFGVGDDPEAVAENRRRAVAAIGADVGRLVVAGQCHGAAVAGRKAFVGFTGNN